MSETSQNTKNFHRHSTSGMIFASILLLCIVIVSLIITFTALGKDEPPAKKDPYTSEDQGKEEEKGDDEKGDEEDEKDPEGSEGEEGSEGNEQNPPPAGNKTVTLENSKIFSGSLILLGETSLYQRPVEELITRSEMGKLSAFKVHSEYGFINLSSGHTGDFILKDNLLYLDKDTAEAFRKMMAAYVAETGHKNIWLRNAYYYDKSEDIAATENINEALLNPHAAGLAVDIQISTAEGKQIPLKNAYAGYPMAEYYDWFLANCHKFGFIHTGDTNSYSSFRYIGVAHATYMAKNGLSLEEYLSVIKANTAQERLVISDDLGKEWWVYYVSSSEGETTDITVFGDLYSVSGNNIDGFVVTIDTSGL